MNKLVILIIILILICVSLFVYCYLCEKNLTNEINNQIHDEKYKEIRKFEEQNDLVKNNYYVVSDNDNEDIVRGNQYPLNQRKYHLDRMRGINRVERRERSIMPKLTEDGIKVRPYGYYNEVPDINEYIHSFDYNTGHRVLDGFDIYNTRAMNDITLKDLNVINVNDFYQPYDFKYKPVINGSIYPIRDSQVELRDGKISSIYPNVCAMYSSSNLPDNINMYFPSTWCDIGILTNNNATVPFTVLNLYAQFRGGGLPWKYRVYNKLTSSYIFLSENTRGSGSYGALIDNDNVSNIPGFPGTWNVQIQKDRTYIFGN